MKHGYSAYTNRGCRCDVCSQANRDRSRAYYRAVVAGERTRRHVPDFETRFWEKVRHADGCWEWTGAIDDGGYGRVLDDGKSRKAHRVSLAMTLGRPILPGHVVAHLCDNPPCVRPDHLEETTQRRNIHRAIEMGRAPHIAIWSI